jgi:PAS domain S-box-containing protein
MAQALSGDKLLNTFLSQTDVVGIFVWDFDGRILQANDAFLRIVGYEREDLAAGRLRWPDLTPPDLLDSQAERLREHKKTGRLQAFEKEYSRKDGTRVPVLVGVSRFEERGDQGVAFVLDVSEHKRAEAEHRAHVWFLESMDRINRAMQGTNDVETMMGDVLAAVLEVFESDRAWLLHSRDADATTWRAVMERTRPEFASAAAKDHDLVMSGDAAQVVRDALASPGSLPAGPGHERQVKRDTAEHAQVQSEILMALRPKGGRAYLFGLHQCSRPRTWTKDEQRLFEEIGHRLSDALANLIVMRGLRESEERFRALVQFSFDVYWETDVQHRFIRQDISERAPEGPLPGSEIGKTRWELPYLEIDEEAWRKHREMLDAHLPFRDLEYARPTPGGGKRYAAVSGLPMFDETGRFVGYRGVARHITERKLAEAEHRAHVWFLESLDRINRTMQAASDLERMMSDVLEAVLEVLSCDRAWLVYPCDPQAASWHVVMERTRPQFPGGFALQSDFPTDAGIAAGFAAARAASGAVLEVPAMLAERFAVRSRMAMAVYPKGDAPYLFGVHQCSHARAWTADEQRLFEEIGRRLTDALSNLIAVRNLRESEHRLEAAQRLAHVGWWERDYATGHVSLSDEACRIFGVQPLELPHWHGRWLSLIHPEDRQKTADASERALRGEARYDVEYRVVRPDGTVRAVHSQGDVTRDEAGRAVRQFGVMQDITELRLTERRLEAAQRLAHVGWWERDYAAGRWLTSDEIRQIYGIAEMDRVMDLAEWMRVVPSIIHPEDRQRVLEASEASLRGGPRYDIEYRIVHADGTVRVVHVQADVTRDEAGRPVRQFGVAQDITDLRQAEQDLRARQEMLDLAQTAARAVAFDWYIGARESANRWSPELEAMYGLEPGTFDGTYEGWKKLIHPDDWRAVKVAIKHAHESGDIAAEYRVIHKDGTVHWLRAKGRMFFDTEGRPERMVGFMFDVSDQRHAEETLREKDHALEIARTELAHVSRLTTLGELTTSIAHEVSQPLGAMMASAAAGARWLAAEPPDIAEARSTLDNIAADGKRAREVIARIRALTKRQAPRTEQLDINQKILEVLALTERELRSHDIVLRTQLDSTLPRVAGDRVQLQQVLLNLIVNAVDAMSAVHDRQRELTIVSAADGPNAAVVVEVRDSGPGMPPEALERVFEPFYTTKAEGIGIGLSISRSIVEAHGGRLWASANEPHGAVFRFSLPALPT